MRRLIKLDTSFIDSLLGTNLLYLSVSKGSFEINNCNKFSISNDIKLVFQNKSNEFFLLEFEFVEKLYSIDYDLIVTPKIIKFETCDSMDNLSNIVIHNTFLDEIKNIEINNRIIEYPMKEIEFFYSISFGCGENYLIFNWTDVPNTMELNVDNGSIYNYLKNNENWL
jgi:hypothetical protein